MPIYIYTKGFELTTDLKGKTISQLQELGWKGIRGASGWTLDNDGLKNGNNTNNRVHLAFDLSGYDLSGKKIILYQEGNLVSNATYAGVGRFKLANTYEGTITNYCTMVWGGSPNNIDTSGLFIGGNQRVGTWNNGSGNYTANLEINFSTGEVKINLTGTQSVNTTYTMTQSEINTILQTKYILFYTTNYQSGYRNSITLASIKII